MASGKSPKVSVWVPWGYDQIECEVSGRKWRQILAGKDTWVSFETGFEDWYGEVTFHFNGDGYGSLYASYGDDGGTIFVDSLDEAAIQIDDVEIPWSQLKRPPKKKSARKSATRKSTLKKAASGKVTPPKSPPAE